MACYIVLYSMEEKKGVADVNNKSDGEDLSRKVI